MSAKEMFEKLGYRQDMNEKTFISYYGVNCKQGIIDCRITFDIPTKEFIVFSPYELDDYEDCSIFVDMSLLQAINKQVEELGWK